MNERLPEVLVKFVRKELGLQIPGELSEVIVDYLPDPDKDREFLLVARLVPKQLTMWKDHPDERLYEQFPYKDDRVKQHKWVVEQLRLDLLEYECFICKETHVTGRKRQKVK